MAYAKRHFGSTHRHDPLRNAICVHGGTCLAHRHTDPFAVNAQPNNFSLSFPTGKCPPTHRFGPRFPTFGKALEEARRMAATPELEGSTIYACTDLIRRNSYSGQYEVQRVG